VPVTLFWETPHPLTERYKVTAQLLDGTGRLVAQHDSEPGAGFAPTDAWVPGVQVIDRHGIALPAGLPAGRYTLVVALYHVATGERLDVLLDGEAVGDHVSLAEVEIGPGS
jgi:hypothetical protein